MKSASRELEAVLHIFLHDEELKQKALPHVDVARQEMDWGRIFQPDYDSGHYAAVLWAYSLWRDRPAGSNLFNDSLSMDAGLRRTVIRAIAIRWGIPIDNIRTLEIA